MAEVTKEDSAAATLKMKITAMLVAVAIVAGCVVMIFSVQATREVATGIAAAFRPNTKFNTVLGGTIGQLNNNPKLVVLTADIQATVLQENTTTFAGFTVGSASVEISAPAKVQWYVPVNLLSSKDFVYDAEKKRLVVTVPKPVLDTDVVAIEIDPTKVSIKTELGISPLSVFKTKGTREEAMKHLKEAAIQQGGHELLRDRAHKNAKDSVAKQLAPVAEVLNEGVTLEVEFAK